MDPRAVTEVLDRALLEVGDARFKSLVGNKGPEDWVVDVGRALKSLERLQTGLQPDYADPWVVLFYLLWYQPKQINLAYSAIKKMLNQRGDGGLVLGGGSQLHVVDFGCGSMAMQFAVALAAADALESGQHITSITISSYDVNYPMIEMGIWLWCQFKRDVEDDPRLGTLALAVDTIETRGMTTKGEESLLIGPEEERWVSAIHAIYDSNKFQVQNDLAEIATKIDPAAGFISGHVSTWRFLASQAVERLKSVSPFEGGVYDVGSGDVNPEFFGWLPCVTNWREQRHGEVEAIARLREFEGNDLIRNGYLSRNVYWKWPTAKCLIYTK